MNGSLGCFFVFMSFFGGGSPQKLFVGLVWFGLVCLFFGMTPKTAARPSSPQDGYTLCWQAIF